MTRIEIASIILGVAALISLLFALSSGRPRVTTIETTRQRDSDDA